MNPLEQLDIHQAFGEWDETINRAGHAENEVEREPLAAKAAAIAEPWQSGKYAEDWNFLRDLREQWREDPDRMREETAAALAGRDRYTEVDEATATRQSHMSHMQFFFDPREKEIDAWREMHSHTAFLHGTMALARDEAEIDAIQAKIQALHDQTTWPESWKEREAAIAEDPEWYYDRSAQASEYAQMIRERPQDLPKYAPFLSEDELAQYTEPQPEIELEESL